MKKYPKDKFKFLNKESVNGDMYFHEEWRLCKKFPFFRCDVLVMYRLIDDEWVEQEDK